MNKFWGHLKTITHHRHLVMRGCFRMGLIWQGLTHDLSKYSPTEFLAGVRYYQGDRSPNTAEREANGYSLGLALYCLTCSNNCSVFLPRTSVLFVRCTV